jgi:hypothetical protein
MKLLTTLLALASCQPPASTTTVSLTTETSSSSSPSLPPVAPRSIADDPSRTTDERCADAFATFRTRIHAGDTAAQVKAVLGSPTWIGSDEPVDVLGGEVPVDMKFTDQTVAFMCLPKPDPRVNGSLWSPWVIYARLEGRDHKRFGAFLASGSSKKLVEYALCHVASNGIDMKIEKFP